MIKKKLIIESLKDLCLKDSIIVGSDEIIDSQYEPIKEYLEKLTLNVKPETAVSEVIGHFFLDVLGLSGNTEVNFGGDFIDYVIRESSVGNPICLEIKPFFRYDKKKMELRQMNFSYYMHQVQIQKYLRHKQVEYVILTNLNKAYIFNRNAIIDFKPFAETTFYKIFEDYLIYENLWDTIRRYEDNIILSELGNEFFKDLENWYDKLKNVDYKVNGRISKDEIIVLLLNKFIFIKTLEDYGLIPYRFIQDEYERLVDKWKAKGYHNVFRHFFNEIEDFFEMYYDTELFKSNFWNFIENNEANIFKFQRAFELILGLNAWSQTFGKGLVHYNYRQIDEDIFGKAYETWIAENKKDEGIFYTPAIITDYMANKLVDTLFDEPVNNLINELKNSIPNKIEIDALVKKIRNIKIIDSSSGSGSFLIKVLKAIYKKYLLLDEATKWAAQYVNENFDNVPDNIIFVRNFRTDMNFILGSELIFISSIILNHIFAADKDERAIDTAKTNIWKEAVKLNPRIYNFHRLDDKKMHILPNLVMNFIAGDSLTDIDFERQIDIITSEFKEEIIKLFEIRNNYLADPYNPELLQDTSKIKEKIRNRLKQEQDLFEDSLYFPLEFFFCFFSSDGSSLEPEKRGFDGIISNPPWEAMKPVKKEFAKLNKKEMDILHFNDWFDAQMESNQEFKERWKNYTDFYKIYTEKLYSKYSHQSSGDPNYYKFFLERGFQLIKTNGHFCLLVPSGFQTDAGSNLLRKLLINDFHLLELSSFENRGYYNGIEDAKIKLFPDVDNRYKFSIVFAKKENLNGNIHKFNAKFYLQDPIDLDNNNFILYDIEKIKKFSPENWSIMEFKSDNDYELCLKILDNNKFLSDLSFVLRRELDMTNDSKMFVSVKDSKSQKSNILRSEFHMTNDSKIFVSVKDSKSQKTKEMLKLYEGKMIHQFTAKFSNHRYVINESEARTILLHKVFHRIKSQNNFSNEDTENLIIPDNILLDYQTYRLVYRAIGSTTNERTLISCIVPKNVFVGHSMNHIVNVKYEIEQNRILSERIDYKELIILMSLFNSLTLNYYIRNKISANLTMNFIYELPIAEANEKDRQRIIELGFSLLYRKSNKKDFEDLKKELSVEVDSSRELEDIRAELEIIIAKNLYKLDRSDWEYLTSTFVFGGESDTKKELDEIIRISREKWEEY